MEKVKLAPKGEPAKKVPAMVEVEEEEVTKEEKLVVEPEVVEVAKVEAEVEPVVVVEVDDRPDPHQH